MSRRLLGVALLSGVSACGAPSVGGGLAASRVEVAAVHFERGNLDEAARIYEDLLARRPANADYLYGLALVRERQGRTEEARTIYLRAIEVQPVFPEAMVNLAHLEAQRGNRAEADRWYQEAMADDRSGKARYCYGRYLEDQGDTAGALRQYRIALAMSPGLRVAEEGVGRLAPTVGPTE